MPEHTVFSSFLSITLFSSILAYLLLMLVRFPNSASGFHAF
jgi:hypothetical protein